MKQKSKEVSWPSLFNSEAHVISDVSNSSILQKAIHQIEPVNGSSVQLLLYLNEPKNDLSKNSGNN
jgi:hypothetical protein